MLNIANFRQATLKMSYVGSFSSNKDLKKQFKFYVRSMSKENITLQQIRILDIQYENDFPLITFTVPAVHAADFDKYINQKKMELIQIDG